MKKETNNIKQFNNRKKENLSAEFNKKRADHQMNKLMIILGTALGIIVVIVALILIIRFVFMGKQYESVEVINETEFFISTGSEVKRFKDGFIVCNSDGIKYVNTKGEQIWNEAFMMQKPLTDIGNNMVAVADYNGSSIHIMDDKSVLGKIDTGMPVRKFKTCDNGYVMAVLDNTGNTPIYVYNTEGREMLYFNTTMKGYGYPLEIAISDNGILGAVSYLNVDKGSFYTTLAFYNFGEVGQNYQDSLISNYTYQSALVPEVNFAGNSHAVAIADNRVMFFDGEQIPQNNGDILLKSELKSVYEDDEYVALFYLSDDSTHAYMAEIYDYDGKLKDTVYFDIDYNDVYFHEGRMILYNNSEVMIHVLGGVDKYVGNLEDTILTLIPTAKPQRFVLVTNNEIKTIEFE